MTAKQVCALEGCGVEFAPRKTGGQPQKYCSPNHAKQASNRAKASPAKTIDEVVAEAAERDRSRAERAELRKLTAQEHRIRRYEALLDGALRSYDPTEPVISAPYSRHHPHHEDVLVLGDWHVGQRTTRAETGGMYEQDVSTTREQVMKVWRAYERVLSIARSGRNVKRLHIIYLGDLTEGDRMRPSQAMKVTDEVAVQYVQGFDMLAWLVRQALMLDLSVEVEVIGGNHDRFSAKPGDAGLDELSYRDTWSWLAGEFLKRVLALDIDGGKLEVRNWDTFFGYKEILGVKTVFEHGSSFKWAAGGYGGVPWYAVANLGPRYASMTSEIDLILIGHGHRPALIPFGYGGTILTNGALPATSTFVQAGSKVVSRPRQWRLSIHEDHGITDFTPLYADVPGTLLPRDFWNR